MQPQQQNQWCWAAVAVSVNKFFAPASSWTQCKVVNAELGQTTCCTNGSSTACNQPWYLDRALTRVGNLASWGPGKAALAVVQAEINSCRPLCLRIGWNGGGGHFVAIQGYANTNLNVADPWWGSSVQSYPSFPSTYHGGGSWTHNYFTR